MTFRPATLILVQARDELSRVLPYPQIIKRYSRVCTGSGPTSIYSMHDINEDLDCARLRCIKTQQIQLMRKDQRITETPLLRVSIVDPRYIMVKTQRHAGTGESLTPTAGSNSNPQFIYLLTNPVSCHFNPIYYFRTPRASTSQLLQRAVYGGLGSHLANRHTVLCS